MTIERNYLAVAEDAQDGSWSAYVPDLPGCTAGGASAEEAINNLRISIQLWLDEAAAAGQEIPEPKAIVRSIAAMI